MDTIIDKSLLPMDQKRAELKLMMTPPKLPTGQVWLLTHPDLRKTERIRLVIQALTAYFESWDGHEQKTT